MCNICKYAILEGDIYYCSYKSKHVYEECAKFEADEDLQIEHKEEEE